ncbi:MAG: hypothetical protein U0521_08755 [Anaerolineae bacterium]
MLSRNTVIVATYSRPERLRIQPEQVRVDARQQGGDAVRRHVAPPISRRACAILTSVASRSASA